MLQIFFFFLHHLYHIVPCEARTPFRKAKAELSPAQLMPKMGIKGWSWAKPTSYRCSELWRCYFPLFLRRNLSARLRRSWQGLKLQPGLCQPHCSQPWPSPMDVTSWLNCRCARPYGLAWWPMVIAALLTVTRPVLLFLLRACDAAPWPPWSQRPCWPCCDSCLSLMCLCRYCSAHSFLPMMATAAVVIISYYYYCKRRGIKEKTDNWPYQKMDRKRATQVSKENKRSKTEAAKENHQENPK